IRSELHKVKRIHYSITGPGADQPPVGLFTITRNTGHLYVTQELDREKQDKYMVKATDADEPDSDNSNIRYRISSQEPEEPSPSVFVINPVTGVITVNAEALDRQKYPQYTLLVEAADMAGEGLTEQVKVIITVSANNNNPSVFTQPARFQVLEQDP
ncbi:hypothetical protein XENOCAPTIV_004299, partial [Xenoophorus captivus]